MADELFDLIIIGAGPGGYVAAIRAAQLGMKVVVVERNERLGGVCLNEGCIPSKALLDSSELFALARDRFSRHGIEINPPVLNLLKMMARKDDVVKKLTDGIAFLFKKNRIALIRGVARLDGPDQDGNQVVAVAGEAGAQTLTGKKVLLATGSRAIDVPGIPFDGTTVVNARDALSFEAVPEHLLVIGGGYIGLELGSVWLRLGSTVTVVEMLPNLLPNTDRQVADALMRSLKKQGMNFILGATVDSVDVQGSTALVRISTAGAEPQEIACDKVLVAVGRKSLTADLGLEERQIAVEAGRVRVDENFATSVPGIYAIGDLIHGPLLAHKAMMEGEVFAERLAGQASVVDYEFIPGIIYTWPEAAAVGKTEEQLVAEQMPYTAGRFNFMANGRARCMDETDGFVKVLAHKETGRILGIHIIGPRASDMIAEAVTTMTYGGTAEDIALTFHAHPTLSEAVKEAALDTQKRAIHA